MTLESAELLLQTLERSISDTMHLGKSQDVGTILAMVGQHKQLTGVRIFHPHGIILRSSIPAEEGQMANPDDFDLYKNSAKQSIYVSPDKGEILSIIKPIYNQESCFTCHGNKATILGILNINYSLNRTNEEVAYSAKLFVISSILITIFLTGAISFLLVKFVKRPLCSINDNMLLVEAGDPGIRLVPTGNDEISQLTNSYNSMLNRLDRTKKELESLHYQQLERADRLASIGEMASGIAHEIKNPLAGISAAVSIIKGDYAPDDPRYKILDEVLQQVKRLNRNVNDLLFFGRPSLPEFVVADINEIVSSTLHFAVQYSSVKNIETRMDLTFGLPSVCVDPMQMQQVFLNIILNAFQVMPGGGTLVITSGMMTRGESEYARVEISDTGPGIPPQILDKLFTPFFTTKAQGTGLGLAICKKLIGLHNGDIQARSNEGTGSTFIIELPICKCEDIEKYSANMFLKHKEQL